MATAGLFLPQAFAALALATVAGPANYRIPAGSLDQALALFADTANLSLSYDPAIVQGKTSSELVGSFTVAAGFAKLLAGSGLIATPLTGGGYVLQHAAAVTVELPSGPIAALPDVTVSGMPPDDGYSPATESLATGAATPLSEIPQSVQVISNDIIKDQQDQTLFDVLRNVSGTGNERELLGWNTDAYDLRGFTAIPFLDGGANQYMFNIPAVGIDRVEVLKGADSAIAGELVGPSGLINIITKQPQRETVREATLQTGSFGDVGAALDVGGASSDPRLLYRLVTSVEEADENFGGYRDLRQSYLAPSVAWDDGTTRLVLGLQASHGRLPNFPYTVAIGGRPVASDRLIDNEDEHTDYDQRRLYYQYRRNLNDDWSLHSTASQSTQSATQYEYYVEPLDIDDYALFFGLNRSLRQRNVDTDNSLHGKILAGGVTHNVAFGVAYQSSKLSEGTIYNPATIGSISDTVVPFSSTDPDSVRQDTARQATRALRLYAQDFMTLGQRWRVMTALAFNESWTLQGTVPAWTPTLGISYQLSDLAAAYANYSRSFALQSAILESGEPAPPSIGNSIEAGLKLSWPDKPLDISFAVFHAEQNNLTLPISDSNLVSLIPGGDSRGVEVNLQGMLATGWKAIASYTYTDFSAPGVAVNQIPRHVASLWVTYSFQNADWHNWGVGLGLYGQSAYVGNGLEVFGNFRVPGQTRTDLSLFYRGQRVSVSLGVKNVFDRTLYAGHANTVKVFRDPSRTVMLTATYKF